MQSRKLCLSLAFALLVSASASATELSASIRPQPREQAEPLIRKVIYETAIATFKGDVKLYRSHIARRTLELMRLVYEGLREIPDSAATLNENTLDSADKFIDATFVQGAKQWANLSQDEIDERARAQSTGSLTFLNDQEVVLQFGGSTLRIVYEDKAWKVDETEAAKKLFLDNFQFKPEMRAKIEKL